MKKPTNNDTGNVGGSSSGPSTDSANRPVVDPTDNVMKLVKASSKRIDDLSDARRDWIVSELRRLDDIAELRAAHAKEMRTLESDRLDKIRQVDVTAVKTEADRALAAIQTLAATTATNAETLRNALTNTATAIAKQTSDTVTQLIERIAALEKSSYEGQGRSKVADPQIDALLAEMRRLSTTQTRGDGERRGGQQMWSLFVGGVLALIGILSFAMRFAVKP